MMVARDTNKILNKNEDYFNLTRMINVQLLCVAQNGGIKLTSRINEGAFHPRFKPIFPLWFLCNASKPTILMFDITSNYVIIILTQTIINMIHMGSRD